MSATHRTRSRSPSRAHDSSRAQTHRARSPHRHHHHHHRSKRSSRETPAALPFNSRHLTKSDYRVFRPMLASYLDIQKGLFLEDLEEEEVRGRWKSFLGKWNRGELAEGWYDPVTLQKTIAAAAEFDKTSRDDYSLEKEEQPRDHRQQERRVSSEVKDEDEDEGSDSDDSIGPALPGQESSSRRRRKGPRIPNMQDLELKREIETEDGQLRREDLRYARKVDRKQQKEALEELVPRAAAGTRERQLEKKAEVNATMRAFRDKSPGATAEVPEEELMGGGDGVADFKRQKMELERKKTEREVRKEEILRARAEEREERLKEYRSKEEGTMAMLQALAKQRFG